MFRKLNIATIFGSGWKKQEERFHPVWGKSSGVMVGAFPL
jgi:hypothetical protein